ncbi:MAG TPA: LacI family transcriptional regulator [Lactobacillus sp.]|nr:LacI family transcriptional regulator [Lactobacillus sp.]
MAKHVTLADVAKRVGMAPSTVSRALRDSPRVTPATRAHIHQVAEEMNFQPNFLAQSIRNQQTDTIGVIVSNILNPYFTELLRGIGDELTLSGKRMMLFNTDEQADKETRFLNTLTGQMVDGLIIASTGGIDNYDKLTQTTPTVFVDRVPNADSIHHYDAVLTDNPAAARQLTQRLIDAGSKRIGFIGSQVEFSAVERLNGYQLALTENSLPMKRNLTRQTDYTPAATAKALNELQQQEQIDSLVVADSVILSQVLQNLKGRHQLTSLKLGTFDYLSWFDYLDIKLVAAQQSTYAIGHAAVTTLLNRIATPDAPITTQRLDVTLHQNF